VIGEVQYAINQPAEGDMVIDPDAEPGLPGLYKLGFWYDSARFPSFSQDNAGLPLAGPNSNGEHRFLGSNFSIYGVVDQTIWRPDPAGARAVGVFARIMGAPGDRNLVDFSVNAGITMKAPVAGRDNDSVGIGYGLAQVSPTAVSFDKDANFYHGPYPIRGSESFIEVTYQAAITPWLTVQPDLQYVWTPGGGIRDPLSPDRRVGNETLLGLRTNIGF
jgi:porin